jgi:hypothetical protein
MAFTGRNSPALLQNVMKTGQGLNVIGTPSSHAHTHRGVEVAAKCEFLTKGIIVDTRNVTVVFFLHFRYLCSLKGYVFVIATL